MDPEVTGHWNIVLALGHCKRSRKIHFNSPQFLYFVCLFVKLGLVINNRKYLIPLYLGSFHSKCWTVSYLCFLRWLWLWTESMPSCTSKHHFLPQTCRWMFSKKWRESKTRFNVQAFAVCNRNYASPISSTHLPKNANCSIW